MCAAALSLMGPAGEKERGLNVCVGGSVWRGFCGARGGVWLYGLYLIGSAARGIYGDQMRVRFEDDLLGEMYYHDMCEA